MRPLHIFFGVLVAIIWAGNFIGSKFSVMHFPPLLMAAIRYAIVTLALLPFFSKPNKRLLIDTFFIALVLCTLHVCLWVAAIEQGLDTSGCALVLQLGVPFSCLFGVLLMNERIGRWRMLGILIAFGGITLITGTPNILEHMHAFWLAVASALCWGVGNLLTKRTHQLAALEMTAWLALMSVPQMFIGSLLLESGNWELVTSAPPLAWGGILYSAFISSIIGYSLWYKLVKLYPISHVAPLSLLMPVFSIILGKLVFDERITWHILLGGAITIAGVAIIVIRKPKVKEIGEQV